MNAALFKTAKQTLKNEQLKMISFPLHYAAKEAAICRAFGDNNVGPIHARILTTLAAHNDVHKLGKDNYLLF